jgi:hypothetical protein
MPRLAVVLIGLFALWAVPIASRALDVSGGGAGGCAADCTWTGINRFSNGSSGVTPSSAAEVFAEDDAASLIQIATPNTQSGQLNFADPENASAGSITYDHATDTFTFFTGGVGRWTMNSSGHLLPTATGSYNVGSSSLRVLNVYVSGSVSTPNLSYTGTTFAGLGTPGNGNVTYCSDCTIANPCAGAGTGALAKRLNAVWVCN